MTEVDTSKTNETNDIELIGMQDIETITKELTDQEPDIINSTVKTIRFTKLPDLKIPHRNVNDVIEPVAITLDEQIIYGFTPCGSVAYRDIREFSGEVIRKIVYSNQAVPIYVPEGFAINDSDESRKTVKMIMQYAADESYYMSLLAARNRTISVDNLHAYMARDEEKTPYYRTITLPDGRRGNLLGLVDMTFQSFLNYTSRNIPVNIRFEELITALNRFQLFPKMSRKK